MRRRRIVLAGLYLALCGLVEAQQSSYYPITLKILQTEQVPYTVQVRGGQITTNCSIVGTAPNLRMVCSSYETPPIGWGRVLSAMLAEGSDGNTYIIACDAAWRWSKCRGLRPGDFFAARWTNRGLAVNLGIQNGKRQEATYSVLESKSIK